MVITPAYAVAFALVFVALSVRTLRLRRRYQVAVGHGGEPALERAARAHGNFAEYVPLTLLLIHFLETLGGGAPWIHTLCAALLIGRVLHAFGVSQVREDFRFRVAGMVLTFTAIGGACAGIAMVYLF